MQEHTTKKPKHIEMNYQNDLIITTSWTTISSGPTDFHYDAYDLFNHVLNKNSKNAKLLISEDENNEFIGNANNTPYKNNTVLLALEDKFLNYEKNKPNIIVGKPNILRAQTVVFVDGCLPSKGTIEANKIIIILTNNDNWWAKNIKCFTGTQLELWYDENLDFPITNLIVNLQKVKSNLNIKLKPLYKGIKPDFNNYKVSRDTKRVSFNHTYLVWCASTHSDYYSRDLYKLDRKYQTDILKEIRDIIGSENSHKPAKLILAGWEPNYEIDELIYLNKHLDQKRLEDRRRSSIFAEDLSNYMNCEVEVYPACDLPYEDLILEFDTLIYTPSLRNWEVSNRLIYESFYYQKEIILPQTTLRLLPNNPGLTRQLKRLKIIE